MATSGIPVFKGSSTFSTDFANVISRSVAIASLPIQLLTNSKNSLSSQSAGLTKLDTTFALLQTAIQNVGASLGAAAYETEVSKTGVADVTVAAGATEGIYSINVTSIGSYQASMSSQNWSVAQDVSGEPTTFTLVVGDQNYSITPADNSARSVANAINAQYGTLVQATTVIVAPGDTRVSLKSVGLGPTNLDLLQVPATPAFTGLQQQATTGYAISQTTASWDDSGDASGDPATYTLAIGGNSHVITPASNSPDDVVSAINATYGDQVRASVVDLGTGTAHDYRISLQSTTDGLMNGSMTLDLTNGSGESLQTQQTAATNRTTAAWSATADAAGTRSTYNLMVGGTAYSFTPADNSAASIASAINSLYGAQVLASVVDLGTGGSPDYRISLQSNTGSATTFDIQKTTVTNFQKEQTAGTLASYEINQSGVLNTSNTRTIAVSTGVTANLTGTSGGSPVDMTVSRGTSTLSTALSGFADAYNAAVDEVAAQGDQSGGLNGQSLVWDLSRLLSSISTYTGSGQINSLTGLGLDLGKDGHLTYNAFVMMAADLSNSVGVTSFLGTAEDGGFMKVATDAMARVEDSVTGLLATSKTDVESQITSVTADIAAKQAQVDALEIRLQDQMARSDALIASMQQQYSYFSSLFAAQATANTMYN